MRNLYTLDEQRSQTDNRPPTWHRSEGIVREEYDLTEDRSSWHDARTAGDEPVEVKSCAYEHGDGRIGQFHIWEYQWMELACRGQVAYLVYSLDSYNIVATHMDFLPSITSVGTPVERRHPTMGRERLWRIPWPEVVPLDAITFGIRHNFTEHYSEEEIENTLFRSPPDES
jgi:hypothetical protein